MIIKQVGKSQVETGKTYLVRQDWNVFVSKAAIMRTSGGSEEIYFCDSARHTTTLLRYVTEIYEIIL